MATSKQPVLASSPEILRHTRDLHGTVAMKALVVSDLHLEFSTLDLDVSGVDVVVLAGDIHLGTRAFPWIQA